MMNTEPETFLKQSGRFHVVEVDGAKLLYRPSQQQALHLDPTAAVVWQLCDGTRTAKAVIDEVSSLYPEDHDIVSRDVAETIAMLQSHGVLLASSQKQ